MKFALSSRHRWALAASALLAAACSSQPTNVSQNAPPAPTPVIQYDQTERHPAQAPDLHWNSAPLTISVTGTNSTAKAAVTVNQELTWWETEAFQDVHGEYQDVLVNTTCTDLVCSSGSGNSAAWDAFYKARKDDKDDRLADAIKGIGKATAPKLIAGGYFNSKPRSWDAFVREVNRAADSGVISKSVATQVIYTYRSENAANLGYGNGSCTERARVCSVWQNQIVMVPFINHRQVQRSDIKDRRSFNVNVQISNAKLLPFEQDAFTLQVDENGNVQQNVAGTYNRYAATSSAQNGQVMVNVVGVQRYLRPIPQSVIRTGRFTVVNKAPTFVLDVDPSLIPDAQDSKAQLVVNYTMKSCDLSWITGKCKAFSSYKDLKIDSRPVTAAQTILAFEPGKSGTKIWLEYTVARQLSSFFDDHPTASHTSDELSF